MGIEHAFKQVLKELITGNKQKEIAKKAGIPESSFSQLSTGARKSPRLSTFAKIIDSLDHDAFVQFIKMVRPDAPIEIVDIYNLRTIDVYKMASSKDIDSLKTRKPVFTLRIPPEFFPSDYGVLVNDHSMDPDYPKGCAVGIRDLKEPSEFFAGEDYLCTLPFEGLVIRRILVSQEKGSLEFRPINPDKENFRPQICVFEEAIKKIHGVVTWVSKRM